MIILTLLAFLILGPLGILIYFVPSIIAFKRVHGNRIPIFIVNLFFGWCLVGYVIALAWSLTGYVYNNNFGKVVSHQ